MNAQNVLTVGSFLPYSEFSSAPDGVSVPLRRRGRHATLLVRVHSAGCSDCRRYLTELAAANTAFASWDGRVVVLVPGPLADASAMRAELRLPFTVLSDADERAPLADGASVVVADRYGHVYFVDPAGEGHELPAPPELEEWLKFLGTQCPE